MRVIDLKGRRSVELWSGRRLVVEEPDGLAIYSLPRGYMSQHRTTLSFGSASKTSVTITGSVRMIDAIAEAICEMERPASGWRKVEV